MTHYANEIDDKELIYERIQKWFVYRDEQDGSWQALPKTEGAIMAGKTLLLRYTGSKKLARQMMCVPSPFTLTKGMLYLWGLIAGSTAQQRNAGITVDAAQEPVLQALAEELEVSLKVVPVSRTRQRYGAERVSLNHYRKVKVTFPSVFLNFLKCLGYEPKEPHLPSWLTAEQRIAWVEGYLNSGKLQCQIQHANAITPKLTIYASDLLSHEIAEVLDQGGIGYFIYQREERTQIIVQKRASLIRLTQQFTLRRPKVGALLALLHHIETTPALRLYFRRARLTEFQLTLYGTALKHGASETEEVAYTAFAKTFACSSNTIRQNLYHFDQIGLLTYCEKENHKEYVTLATRYLATIENVIREEERQLKMRLKYTDSNALSFHCSGCDTVVGYAEAIGDHAFECPHCHSKDLHSLETSQYFYYGCLGVLTQQQKIVAGASG